MDLGLFVCFVWVDMGLVVVDLNCLEVVLDYGLEVIQVW